MGRWGGGEQKRPSPSLPIPLSPYLPTRCSRDVSVQNAPDTRHRAVELLDDDLGDALADDRDADPDLGVVDHPRLVAL